VLRTAQIRPPDPRIALCAPKNDEKTEDGARPESMGIRPEKEALRVDSL
jgi:hypothetical protein